MYNAAFWDFRVELVVPQPTPTIIIEQIKNAKTSFTVSIELSYELKTHLLLLDSF